MSSLTADDVSDEVLAAATHLHVSSPHLQSGLRAGLGRLFARARAAGVSVSLDPGWDPEGRWAELEPALAVTDVVFPNAAEARGLTGAEDPEAALAALAERVATVVVTLGPDGAIARRGAELARADAPALEAADATGAGDSLAAGFLCGLANGMALQDALRLGVACGSLSTRALGGVDAQPTLPEALDLARTRPAQEAVR
jgi:sugar/nucleoside kinase (ribokinase family)